MKSLEMKALLKSLKRADDKAIPTKESRYVEDGGEVEEALLPCKTRSSGGGEQGDRYQPEGLRQFRG